MQVKKEKPLGFSYTRRGVRKSLLVFLFLYFMLTFLYILSKLFPFFVGQRIFPVGKLSFKRIA